MPTARGAWEGPLPDQPDVRVRVEAAAYRGRPVFFEVIGPWTRPTLMVPTRTPVADFVLQAIVVAVVIAMMTFAAVVARRNVQSNRADRRGAARLAGYFIAAGFTAWAISAHHVLDANALLDSFFRSCGQLTLFAGSSGSSTSRSNRTCGASGPTACSAGRACWPATCAIRASGATR